MLSRNKLKTIIDDPTPMMECGHAANAITKKDGKDIPCCAICIEMRPSATKVVPTPDLTGRQAKCPYCNTLVASSVELPFFEYRKTKQFDSYYDGCRGWN